MRAASPTFGYGDLDLVELDEQTPLQPARSQGRSSGGRLLPPLVAAGCACLMIAAVAYQRPQNAGGTTLRASKKPHVVLTVLDDAGYDDLWSSSDLAAPHLSALRDEGVELTSHYVASECTPTRGALLTGLHPTSLGLQRGVISQTSRWGLDPSVKTLADVFRSNGYTTALAGKWHLGHSSTEYLPERRGFDSAYGFLGGFVDPYSHYAEAPPVCESDCVVDWSSQSKTYAADAVAHEAKRLISSTSEKPLFLYYALPTPHEPLLEPPSAQYDDRLQGRRRIFGAIASHQDAKIGSVVKSLKDNALWPSTLFVVLADNGAAAAGGSNYPLRGAKGGVWEGGVRTRALVTGPLIPKNVRGSSYEGLFHAADWMPTILSAAGLSYGDGDGVDQWAAIKGLTTPPRDEVIIHVDTSSSGMTGAIRRGRWKLLLNVKREPVYDRTSESAPLDWLADAAATYLYDVEADPSEAVDLSAANPDIVDELSKRLVDVHAHAAEPLYCAPTRDEDEKARSAFRANGNRLGPWAPLSTDRSHCDDDGIEREALLAEACASGRMLASSCARALAAAAAG
ncbi:unnamed protein product [Pelagomonas calceolata]|uniref:Sulfatase N-terminal domain-containing protein n=1 Tax=Pelagomonas calceolata TaxID=35677 RepID=A0A8J2X7K0_9STRA|nr:unnamed protein product [Pelagomonas calceolata]